MREKEYKNGIADVTDIVGIRIILYLEKDISQVDDLLREMFWVDEKNSDDKLDSRSVDTVGYRSLHLICSLGKERSKFLEYQNIHKLKFEIQIRTVLQHTWAVVEHKQNYKPENYLPPALQRRLMLLSATLENADREFSEIVTLAENYAVLAGEMDPRVIGDPISTVAFKAVTTNFIRRARIFRKVRTESEHEFETDFVRILIAYGISSVRKFAELLRRVPLSRLQKFANYLKKTDWYRIPQFVLLATDADGYCRTLAADQGDWIFLESVWRYFDEVESEVPWRAQAEKHGITIHSVEEEAEKNPHSSIILERAIGYFVDVF